jgi:sialic acid synthase SpsE
MNTKIILEACYNHQGDINIAKEIIDEAKLLNVFAVKFQNYWN